MLCIPKCNCLKWISFHLVCFKLPSGNRLARASNPSSLIIVNHEGYPIIMYAPKLQVILRTFFRIHSGLWYFGNSRVCENGWKHRTVTQCQRWSRGSDASAEERLQTRMKLHLLSRLSLPAVWPNSFLLSFLPSFIIALF